MYSELECGVCYRTYNTGRRCPRELRCQHSFCEGCLLALSRPQRGPDGARLGADAFIVCPLCRHTTPLSGEARAELKVDECALELLLAAGDLDQEEEEEEAGHVQDGRGDNEEATLPEESDSSAGSGGRRLRRSWRKVWRKIIGKSSLQCGGENCVSSDDLRNLAMMSCFMF